MKTDIETIKINGIDYVRKDSVGSIAHDVDGLEYVIVRTSSAGVHAGYLKKENDRRVTLIRSRWIWYWAGAATLSQLAVDGTTAPDKCKFPCEVQEVRLNGVIQIIPCSQKAMNSIVGVKVWEK